MGGSEQIKPSFLTPPDVGGLRPQYGGFLSNLMGGQSGQPSIAGMPGNPMQAPLSPLFNQTSQQYAGLIGNQAPFNAAQNTVTQAAQTGLPADFSPFFNNAAFSFQNFMAPQIKESLGSQYGVNFGTPQGEQLARAGAQTTLGAQQAAMPFIDAANQRRLQASQMGLGTQLGLLGGAGQLGAQQTGFQQTQLGQILGALQGGVGTLSGQTGFMMPQFGPNNTQQTIQGIAQLAPLLMMTLM